MSTAETSDLALPRAAAPPTCETCLTDQAFLRTTQRPAYETMDRPVRVVDLFCGGGGLSLGVAEAARRTDRGTVIALAVEHDEGAADVYALNFPKADVRREDISSLFDGEVGGPQTITERALVEAIGQVDIVVAGPPCQGHSDLNNHTRREDPRNALYLRAVRAAEVLQPTYVLIENVPAVRHDTARVVDVALAALRASDYTAVDAVLDLVKLGVPQRRRRHILLATRGNPIDLSAILKAERSCCDHAARDVRWAIEDLVGVSAATGPDSPSRPTPGNLERMRWLHAAPGRKDLPNSMRPACHRDKKHSYISMYGRLSWDESAQTITTGFGSMGQGRFVHPSLPRTITPHEAARLQTLPDFYDLDMTKGRGAWAMVIGNAVPPLLGAQLMEPLIRDLPAPAAPDEAADPASPRPRRSGTPPASSELVRARMSSTKRRDTKPEVALRSALHKLGLRFRVDRKIDGNRRKTDVVFSKERVAVYVDGCFWHACPEHGTLPKANCQWWVDKLANNKARDAATNESLSAEGWLVLRFWEHEDPVAAADLVYRHVMAIRAKRNSALRR